MQLIRDKWTQTDIDDIQKYLESLATNHNVEWTNSLLNTSMPVLVIKTADIKRIVSQIHKGNYLSFLDYMLWEYYENTAINGMLISLIEDFDTQVMYLDRYSALADNWATCDLLSFNCVGREQAYYNVACRYVHSQLPFTRRIGLNILFRLLDNEQYIERILDVVNSLENEEHYYVNMMSAWLLCECFIKQRERTLAFLQNNRLNNFVQNKCIQKCRESLRVSQEDKQMLLLYKRTTSRTKHTM
ncbi:MAG: DNA alkylation repair protein [Clostridia bacterium]|nr:DNA alkylation repair protein [Clostridia bacterium]